MRMFGLGRRGAAASGQGACVPAGMRVYAIGDVHGRFDLLMQLIALIEEDDRARAPAETHVVLLGDLIDRGPQSREVIDLLVRDRPGFARFHVLMGNHEEMLLSLIDAPSEAALAQFLRYGGRETFESYDVPQLMLDLPERYPVGAFTAFIPPEHELFLRTMGDAIHVGDYLFVHAGIRPDVPLDEQVPADVRWIREPFLGSTVDHGVVVVHGHTISRRPELRPNRVGIDTGAYASGVLTALALEEDEQRVLATPAPSRS